MYSGPESPGIFGGLRVEQRHVLGGDVPEFYVFENDAVCAFHWQRIEHDFIDHHRPGLGTRVQVLQRRINLGNKVVLSCADGVPPERHSFLRSPKAEAVDVAGQVSCRIRRIEIDLLAERAQGETCGTSGVVKIIFIKNEVVT